MPSPASLATTSVQPARVVERALSGPAVVLGIAVAGALGALCRWGLGQWCDNWFGARFPYGTLAANLIGCFLLGLIMSWGQEARLLSGEMRLILAVGFIGALTTFSTWSFETLHMARGGEVFLAAGNFAVNVFFGFLLIWAGMRLGGRF